MGRFLPAGRVLSGGWIRGVVLVWLSPATHKLRAVKAGDRSDIPERRRNGILDNGDLQFFALSKDATDMAAAGQKLWRKT